jgi:hypothetical protein
MINVCKNIIRKNLEGREHGGPRRRWEDNIIADVKEIGYNGVGRIHLA